ncbi:glycosyltransferase [Geobacter sp. AOG2]|uniref:glycosyltransferase n=1 Tax=Geobacter sp. AOG2 TaxID=1566347 RepID=UPI001CC3592D|nr:glycosyltransferase [Geobacter sp. AOG2]GFE62735.1 glycosyl transferase family 2 [Geobacter sp. AOG2]
MDQPIISIIIPVKPGFSVTAVQRLAAADYPRDRYEVIVAEGYSPSSQRNRAVAQAQGEIVYFLDDDSLTSPGFLKVVAGHYRDPQVAAVGGPSLTPATDSILQRSIGAALASPLGGGGMRNRYRAQGVARRTDDSELILCNLSFRRERFLACGGLDERLYPNEENELLDRMRHDGAGLIHDPSLAVFRSQRPTWRLLCRQFLNYGRGRAEQTLISRRIQPASLLPALFLVYVLAVPLLVRSLAWLPLAGYGALVLLCAAVEAAKARAPGMFPRLALIYPIIHLAYGAGLWWGLLGALSGRRRTPGGEVNLRQVKGLADPPGTGG